MISVAFLFSLYGMVRMGYISYYSICA
jgi:hypothetical protein